MTNRRRVSPGQSIRPNMTAGHYNDSIPTTMGGLSSQEERSVHREEIIYCVVDPGSPTPPTQRYHTVAVIDSMEMDDLDRLVPKITIEPSDIDECNWAVAHEGVEPSSTCLVCIGGITRADVDILDPQHVYINWNKDTQRLETHPTWGKAHLIKDDPDNGYAVIYISKCPDLEAIPKMRFFTDAKIINRVVTGEVDIVSGRVINPATDDFYKQGDNVTLHDPGNLFPEIEPNATGWAYYRRAYFPSSAQSFEERWEIEHCTLPITEILAKLTDCLHYQDATTTAFFGSANGKPNFIASTFPNRDIPPEVSIDGTNDYSLSVKNPCKLDAVKDVDVIIRRRTDSPLSDPRNLLAPSPRSTTFQEWEIVKIFEQFARWAEFEKQSSAWNLVNFWEGKDPSLCGPVTLECAFDCSCLEDGDTIIGFYDPDGDLYRGISTGSATLGPPSPFDVVLHAISFDASSGVCALKYNKQLIWAFPCGSEPAPILVALPTAIIQSAEYLYISGSRICLALESYLVVSCGVVDGPSAVCVDICPILCLCEEIYSLPDVCDPPPPPPCNCCECLFTEGVLSLTIDWNSDPQGTTDIIQISDCLWEAFFDDAVSGTQTWQITYECDGDWVATGNWPGATNNNTPMSLTGTGDCSGADLDGTPVGAEGTVVADGGIIECEPPPEGCCQEWSGDEAITDFEGTNRGDIEIKIVGGRYPISDGGGGPGSCKKVASAPALMEDVLTGAQCTVIVEFELFWDTHINGGDIDDAACRWHYSIPACTAQPGDQEIGGDGGAIAMCIGGNNCTGALGTCGEPDGFLSTILTIDDPDASVVGCTELITDGGGAMGAAKGLLMPEVDFSVGVWTHKKPRTKVYDRNNPKPPPGNGDEFVKQNSELFKGCGCKKDVVPVINRWTSPTEKQIETVAKTVHNKNQTVPFEDILALLTQFVEETY